MEEESEKIPGGFTLWARKTTDSDIFINKPDKWFKIWFYLVNRVNHTKTDNYNKGECFLIYSEISEYTKASIDQIKKCLTYLKKTSKISTTRSTRGVRLKIAKYSHYQCVDNYNFNDKSTTLGTREALEKHQRSTPINKNDKNYKNDKNVVLRTSNEVAGVEDLMKLFYTINPTLNWGNKTIRKSASDLIKRFGLPATLKMAEQIIAVQGKPYAPVATTPHQMKEKLAQFKIYFDSQKNNKSNFKIL